MKLEDQVSSLELSKRLKELGVRRESYFWWSLEREDDKNPEIVPIEDETDKSWFDGIGLIGISAFTVAELGEMFLDHPTDNFQTYFNRDKGYYVGQFENRYGFYAPTEADARAKMLIYLIENNLLKGE